MAHLGWVSGEDLWNWRNSTRQITSACIHNPQTTDEYLWELDWLLTAVAAVDRLALKLETYRTVATIGVERSLPELSALWQRRLQEKVPVQYLLGRVEWRNFTLTVAPGVLIPRPETERLIDLAMAAAPISQEEPMHWADLGTGSGAIAIALATHFCAATIHAVDTSNIALDIAKHNTQKLGLMDRVKFYHGNWLEPLAPLTGMLTGIISNPPYIPSALVPNLQPEVAHHEPHLALDGGTDGLDAFRMIVKHAPQVLKSGGVLLLEMMMGQADAVSTLLRESGDYNNIQIHSDLAGIQRFAQAHRIE
jgi:release factor glutamine methyltransferase